MARTTKKAKNFDLATAEVADGALPALRSAYEAVGIKDLRYREKSFGAYRQRLQGMNLMELHDHAFEYRVLTTHNREVMIDRLERKYLEQNPDAKDAYHRELTGRQAAEGELTVAQQAERVLARAR